MKRWIAVVVLSCSIGMAQQADEPVRIEHYTKAELDQIKDAVEVIRLAEKGKEDVIDQIQRGHGVLKRSEGGGCAPYDTVEHRGESTLIITRITPVPDEKGKCEPDYSAEGREFFRIKG